MPQSLLALLIIVYPVSNSKFVRLACSPRSLNHHRSLFNFSLLFGVGVPIIRGSNLERLFSDLVLFNDVVELRDGVHSGAFATCLQFALLHLPVATLVDAYFPSLFNSQRCLLPHSKPDGILTLYLSCPIIRDKHHCRHLYWLSSEQRHNVLYVYQVF